MAKRSRKPRPRRKPETAVEQYTPDPEPQPKVKQDISQIKAQVHERLGMPEDHYRTDLTIMRCGLRARCNVRRRVQDSFEVHITDSFYLWLDKDGEIVQSDPPIQKRYSQAG